MTNKSYGQKSPGYQPEESCKKGACTPPNTSPAEFIDHECDMVHIACTPVCFKGKFYIAKEGATGDPDAAANKENWLGSFDYIDGMFWKAMMECASPHPDAVEQLTYTVITNNNGTQSFVSSDPNVPDILLNQPTPIPDTDNTCTITALTDQTSGATTITETCRDKDGNIISTKEVFVIQAGAIDTINAIAEPDAEGCIFVTRPDLSMVKMVDWDVFKCSKGETNKTPTNNTSALFSVNTTALGGPTDPAVRVVATEVLPAGGTQPSPAVPQGPITVATQTICKDDVCTGDCADYFNEVLLAWELNTNNSDQADGTDSKDLRSVVGKITISNNDGYLWTNNNGNDVKSDGDSAYRSEGDTRPVPFGTDGCITITTEVLSFPDPATMDNAGFVSTKTSVLRCQCTN